MKDDLLLFKTGQSVVFEGDSLTNRGIPPNKDTWPYLRLMNWHRTWADQLAELLFCWKPDLKLSFHNAAVGGSCCRDLLERLDKGVLPYHPDWVLLTIGNNDPNYNISIEEFIEKITAYVKRLNDACNTKVVFIAGFKAAPNGSEGNKGFFDRCVPYHAALKKIADETGNHYIDVGEALYKKAVALYEQSPIHTIYSDGVHLNEVGSIIVAGEILKAFGIVNA